MLTSQDYCFLNALIDEYLNDYKDSGQQIFQQDPFLFNICLRPILLASLQIFPDIQKLGMLVIPDLRAYHCIFHSGYNIALALNYANSCWIKFGRMAAKGTKSTLLPIQAAFTFEWGL